MKSKRFPLISFGILMMLISVVPTVIGMMRAFSAASEQEASAAIESGVRLAFHPLFIVCASVGTILVYVGIFRSIRY